MDFWEKLKTAPVLFDGAMGTYYGEKYDHTPEYCELANLKYPDRVESIHREYIAAGCDAIKTNTFGANPDSLDCDKQSVLSLIEAGWQIARRAVSGSDAVVFADLGPIPHKKERDNAHLYRMIIDKFLDLGAKNFLFETFSNPNTLEPLAAYIKENAPEAKIICSFALSPDGFTREGVSLAQIKAAMDFNENIDAFGLNCVSGPNHMIRLIRELGSCRKPLIAMPNSGYPTTIGRRTFFENNAEYFAKEISQFPAAGARIIGGCCGTTPEHLLRTSQALRTAANEHFNYTVTKPSSPIEPTENRLWQKLERGERVIAVELDPPANSDIRSFISSASALKAAGADAITIADCPISRPRADSSLLAAKLKRELDIDPIPHMTCRDRNIIATKALLLGLNLEGVGNILAVTGDPVPTAQRGSIKSVFNFNSVVLISFIKQLSEELCCGPFRVFGALNLNAVNFDIQLHHAKEKITAGADGFLTQPVHSERALENLKLARAELNAKLLGGVMPIVSHRNACFMNSEIAGITVSEEIVRRYEGLDKDASSELAVSLTTDIARSMSEYVDGYYIITPFSRTDIVRRIMDNLK